MKIYKRRDLTIIEQNNQSDMVIVCDSCGGIGQKSGDIFKLPTFFVGKFTARVAILELLCARAKPIVVSNGVTCELNPTGDEIIKGIKSELKIAGFENVIITGSTEENFETSMTYVALTMIGMAGKKGLLFGKALKGDKIILFGLPQMGQDVDLDDNSIYGILDDLLKNENVKEIVPIGSKGILYESQIIAELNGLNFSEYNISVDLTKSAGPATCLIAVSQLDIDGGIVIGELC